MEDLLKQIDTWIADMKYDLSRENSDASPHELMLQTIQLQQARALLDGIGPNDNIPKHLIIETI